jgi:hypothetical protein
MTAATQIPSALLQGTLRASALLLLLLLIEPLTQQGLLTRQRAGAMPTHRTL